MTCRQQMKWKVGNFLGETVTLKPRFLTLGGRALLLSIVVPHTLLLASVVGQAHCCSVVTLLTLSTLKCRAERKFRRRLEEFFFRSFADG